MTTGYSLRHSALDALWRFRRPDVPLQVVLRNTLAVVAPIAAGFASGHVEAGIGVGVGALNVMFCDQPGPYRQRLALIALASFAGALAALLGFLLGAQPWLLVPVLALASFAGGLLVMYGPDIARVGMISMILLVITAATPLPASAAVVASGAILAGGLLQALLSVAAWPLQRYLPERLALAEVYRGLAAQARQADADDTPPPLTEAMTRLQQTLLGRMHARGRAMEAFRVLLELAERIRLELLQPPPLPAAVAQTLDGIAAALESADPPRAAEAALSDLDADPGAVALAALRGQLGAAARNANWAGARGELRARDADALLPRPLRGESALATLRANLHPQSAALRHAVRCAVVVSAALALSRALGMPRGYWLPMTVAIVLRPDFGATFSFGLLRVTGTLLGLLLTTVLLHLTPGTVWPDLLLMAVLCFAFRYLAGAHYGLAVAALTGTVVILLSFEGLNATTTLLERVANTLAGSAVALAAYLLWPTWERRRTRSVMAGMLGAYADYLRTLTVADVGARANARRRARAARSNAIASLERLRAEPGTSTMLRVLAEDLLANGHRLIRAAMSVEALLQRHTLHAAPAASATLLASLGDAVRELGTALEAGRAARLDPDLRRRQRALAAAATEPVERELAALADRLVDAIDTLGHRVRP